MTTQRFTLASLMSAVVCAFMLLGAPTARAQVAAQDSVLLDPFDPVPEIQFADYIYPGLDQLISEAARLRYRSAGEFTCPITVRSPFGGGIFGGQTHSQSPEALFVHVAGLKTVVPSNPYDAKGLLIAAIEDPDPVIFLEPKRLYNGPFDGHHERPVTAWSKHELGEVADGAGDRLQDLERLLHGDPPALADQLEQRHAVEQLHHVVWAAVGELPEREDVDDVAVADLVDRARLGDEARDDRRIGGVPSAEDFDRGRFAD